MIFIESVEPGAVTLTDSAKFMEGHRAMLGPGDVGALLRVLEGQRSEMRSLDGDFEFRRSARSGDPDFKVSICDERSALPISHAAVLKCALERACLDVMRTRT